MVTVVIQHHLAVAGQPSIRFKSGCAKTYGSPERVDRIFAFQGPGSSMGKQDGRTGQGRKPRRHGCQYARAATEKR